MTKTCRCVSTYDDPHFAIHEEMTCLRAQLVNVHCVYTITDLIRFTADFYRVGELYALTFADVSSLWYKQDDMDNEIR